jgi:hypothetical protein
MEHALVIEKKVTVVIASHLGVTKEATVQSIDGKTYSETQRLVVSLKYADQHSAIFPAMKR